MSKTTPSRRRARMRACLSLVVGLAALCAACGEGDPPRAARTPGAGENADAGGADAEMEAAAIETFNGCDPEDYVDSSGATQSRTVAIAAVGLTFTPKCMIVAVGQSVRWEGNLAAHPLAPGNPEDGQAGSAGSPIVETSSGRSVEFAFDAPGTFPYYCTLHAFGAGQGMAGSIHVRE